MTDHDYTPGKFYGGSVLQITFRVLKVQPFRVSGVRQAMKRSTYAKFYRKLRSVEIIGIAGEYDRSTIIGLSNLIYPIPRAVTDGSHSCWRTYNIYVCGSPTA